MKKISIDNLKKLVPLACGGNKSGMALVVVLGLISLLLISSVTFAILMRIERASSANARNTIMARQMAKSTLAYALASIDNNIGTDKWPKWQNSNDRTKPYWTYYSNPNLPMNRPSTSSEDRRTIYFWKDTFGSVDHNITTIEDEHKENRAMARIVGGQIQNYLPYGIRHRAYAQHYQPRNGNEFPEYHGPGYDEEPMDYLAITPEWVAITAGTNAVNMSDTLGRGAYLAFNTSGFLDIPAICKGGGKDRAYGASPAEIQPVSAMFNASYGGGDPAGKFKSDNKDRIYETVAEIGKANPLTGNKNSLNGTVFADGATYSAFNFSPVGRMPTNEFPSTLWKRLYEGNNIFPFVNRINIAGDGGDQHLKSLRAHKAAIITAFELSGLTESSHAFYHGDIEDKACTDKKCTVCGGTAKAYTLKKNDICEQALWAYLGLIDYIDSDDMPEPMSPNHMTLSVDEQYEAYARPVTENVPVCNGFMTTMKIIREERALEEDFTFYDVTTGEQKTTKRKYFDCTNIIYAVEFNGKVVFANRNAAEEDTDTLDDILSHGIEAKIAFCFNSRQEIDKAKWNSAVWDALLDAAENVQFGKDYNAAAFDGDLSGEDGIFFKSQGDIVFGDGPVCFFPTKRIEAVVPLPKAIEDPTANNEENLWGFPEDIYVGAQGRVFDSNNKVLHQMPALDDFYEDGDAAVKLSPCFNSEDEGVGFDKACLTEPVPGASAVYQSRDLAAVQGNQPNYTLKRKVVNLVMWAEMIDPAFSCASAAESLVRDVSSSNENSPRSTAVSHHEHGGNGYGKWWNFATAHPEGVIEGFWDFDPKDNRAPKPSDFFDSIDVVKNVANQDAEANANFDDFVKDFREDCEEFYGYFVFDPQTEGTKGEGTRYSGYSIFQKYLLTDVDAVNSFKGIRDGIRRNEFEEENTDDSNEKIGIDRFFQQFNSLHVRNGGLDSVGELGFLPIGPYATIRLCGFKDERDNYGLSQKAGGEINAFNLIPYQADNDLYDRPFHRVLDFFAATNKPMRGLVNINGGDTLTTASVFNGAPLDDFRKDSIEDADEVLDEDDARDFIAESLFVAFENRCDGVASTLSDIGWLYDSGDESLYGDIVDNLSKKGKGVYCASNQGREAIIRNSCGLFTDRGLNYSLVMRGEAYTPLFGSGSVQSESGTTLSSREAFAQIWRDTLPDEDGNYPYFIQYFKIFDE